MPSPLRRGQSHCLLTSSLWLKVMAIWMSMEKQRDDFFFVVWDCFRTVDPVVELSAFAVSKMSNASQQPQPRRTRRGSTSTSTSADEAPRSPPSGIINPTAPTPAVISNVHRDWQKMRYNRRSAASSQDVTPASSHRGSPTVAPQATDAAPRPSFMTWSTHSSPLQAAARPQTYVSPLAEWALASRPTRVD